MKGRRGKTVRFDCDCPPELAVYVVLSHLRVAPCPQFLYPKQASRDSAERASVAQR